MELFDTHAHLDDEQFDATREQVFQRAEQAAVRHVIVVGTDLASSEKCVQIASDYSIAHAAVGIQPNYVHQAQPEDWQEIELLAKNPHVVAIGETGLDRYWDHAPFKLQQEYFDRHIGLSMQTGKPFIVHMRDCGSDIVDTLRKHSSSQLSGVMHSFTGDLELAETCMEMGLYISFAGMVTFKKSDELRAVARQIPDDRLLIETDAPYLSPHPHRGQRINEPALVRFTAHCLAEVRGVTLEQLGKLTSTNAKRLFLKEESVD
jgi:TatD DNase family protein